MRNKMNIIRLSEIQSIIKIHKVNLKTPVILMIWRKIDFYVTTNSTNPTIFRSKKISPGEF